MNIEKRLEHIERIVFDDLYAPKCPHRKKEETLRVYLCEHPDSPGEHDGPDGYIYRCKPDCCPFWNQ